VSPLAQCLQARQQTRPIILPAGREIGVQLGVIEAGREQRIALRVSGLCSVGLRDAHVPDEHR
jgi:hypothetical protein